MNKQFIERYKQLEVISDDMYQWNYGPLTLDLWFEHHKFVLRIISNLDWKNPIEEIQFKRKEGVVNYEKISKIDLRNIEKYLNLYKKKIIDWYYDNDYVYSYDSAWVYILEWIRGFHKYCNHDDNSDEELECNYTVTSSLARFVTEKYLNDKFDLKWDGEEFDYIMDLTNELLTYGDHGTRELMTVWFIEDLQIPQKYLGKMKEIVKHKKIQERIQDIDNFWMKWILIP